jgi:hypothetical protein
VTVALLLVLVLPGAVYSEQTFQDIFRSHDYPFALNRSEQRALVTLRADRGRLLTTPYLSSALPAVSGRISEPVAPGPVIDALFDGRLEHRRLKRLLVDQQIDVLVSDCLPGRADLRAALAPLGFRTVSYGCARVYARSR